MELPFKYIVLKIIKELRERNMPLEVDRSNLINYFKTIINRAYLTIEQKLEIGKNFDIEEELSELTYKYYYYFDTEGTKIIFDSDFVEELDTLILEEKNENDIEIINDIDFIIDDNKITFLEIIGVKIKKELYNFLLQTEEDIEYCYGALYDLNNYKNVDKEKETKLINEIKKHYIKKRIMLLNSINLLSYVEYQDLVRYSGKIVEEQNDLDSVSLLLEDDIFNEYDIMYDVFLRSIFTDNSSYASNLNETLIMNIGKLLHNIKDDTIIFYTTFLELLDKEIENEDELLKMELMKIKYRLMNTLDSVYGLTLFMNNKDCINSSVSSENYVFIEGAVHYFVKELLMYDDGKYKNKDYNTDNIITYLNNIIKKLLIQTYYNLTNDKNIINEIKNNELYGINMISSKLLEDIINNPKSRKREI